MKKLKERRGETFVESLTAILIIVISIGVFATGIDVSFKFNNQAKEMDSKFVEDSNDAETEDCDKDGNVVKIVFDDEAGAKTIKVKFSSEDSEFKSYIPDVS